MLPQSCAGPNNPVVANAACTAIEGDLVWPRGAVAVRGGVGGRAHLSVCSDAAGGHERCLVHPTGRALHHDPARVSFMRWDGARSRPPASTRCEPGAQWAFSVASGDGEVSRARSSGHWSEDQFATPRGPARVVAGVADAETAMGIWLLEHSRQSGSGGPHVASSGTGAPLESRSSVSASAKEEAAVQALASRPAASCAVSVARPSRTPCKWATWWRNSASGPGACGGCKICAIRRRSPRCRYCQASATAGHQHRRCSAPASPWPHSGHDA